MALTYKIQDDGTPQPMGDTQGLLVPSMARFCRGVLLNPGGSIPADTRTTLKFTRQMGENWFDSDGNLVIPVAGVYNMNLFFRTSDSTLKTLDLQYARGASSTSNGQLSFSISGTDYLSLGAKTDFAAVVLSASKAYSDVLVGRQHYKCG